MCVISDDSEEEERNQTLALLNDSATQRCTTRRADTVRRVTLKSRASLNVCPAEEKGVYEERNQALVLWNNSTTCNHSCSSRTR